MAHIKKSGWPSADHELSYLSQEAMRVLLLEQDGNGPGILESHRH